jgi:DNA-binding response OmpR family regulator
MAYILIVEDDEDQANTMTRVLQADGHEVQSAADIKTGFEMLEKRLADVVLLDLMFPGNLSGGFDLARKLRADSRFKELPIIMLTAINQLFAFQFGSKDIDPEWMPVTEYLDKPVDFEELKAKVKSLCKLNRSEAAKDPAGEGA